MKRRADNRRRDNVNFCRSEPLSPFKILVSGHTFKIQGQFKFGASNISGSVALPKHIYNPITAMGFSAMFTFQLNNTKR